MSEMAQFKLYIQSELEKRLTEMPNLGYEEGVPSHLVYENGTLYAADTANNRIVALNTQSGSIGSNIQPNYDGTVQKMVNNANLSTLISGVNVDGMSKPSGLEIHDNMFFVSDNETSRIFAFNREGQLLDWIDLDLPPDSIMGMAFDNAGMLYVVDAEAEQILQLSPKWDVDAASPREAVK